MSGEADGDNAELDFAQAFKDLARGERAAAALEDHLDSLERKIEELLAKADEDERKMKAQSNTSSDAPSTDTNDKGTS